MEYDEELKIVTVKSIKVPTPYIKEHSTIIATEWHSGEGADFSMVDDKIIALHMDEIKAIVKVAFALGFVEVS